ncbi:hypothetical protein F0562_032461 [Nyssa sinensis]|uniref:Uncharacterized protein n=1 Tax=Nyssa sinensis TaxID=561372 RepID=A0A5J5AQE8_9ASTE|nr:hypothetical protein F0562_032461 [Nyssa sinensis]
MDYGICFSSVAVEEPKIQQEIVVILTAPYLAKTKNTHKPVLSSVNHAQSIRSTETEVSLCFWAVDIDGCCWAAGLGFYYVLVMFSLWFVVNWVFCLGSVFYLHRHLELESLGSPLWVTLNVSFCSGIDVD